MDPAAVVQLAAAVLGTGAVTAVLNALFNRRKLSADATQIINQAASSAVERSEKDNDRLRGENTEKELRIRMQDRTIDLLIDVVRQQRDFGKRAAGVIRSMGGQIEDPPEIPAELIPS